jgi:hypothetical protein
VRIEIDSRRHVGSASQSLLVLLLLALVVWYVVPDVRWRLSRTNAELGRLHDKQVGDAVRLSVRREGNTIDVTVTLQASGGPATL